MPQDMINKIMIEENIFPRWEHNIPTLGTKHSHAGNKTRLRLVVTLLLMMVVGVSGVKADGYEGIYFLQNVGDISYYLCPSTNVNQVWDRDASKPFLTTYKLERTSDYEVFVWKIKQTNDGYYYLIHDGKYLTINDAPVSSEPHRRRVHLEAFAREDDLTDANKFVISVDYTPAGTAVNIKHKDLVVSSSGEHKYLNPSGNNQDNWGPDSGHSGMIGLWKEATGGSQWNLVNPICTAPTIAYEGTDKIRITAVKGATIYYTTDGSDPTDVNNVGRFSKESSDVTIETTEDIVITSDVKKVKAYAVKTVEETTFTPSEVITFNLLTTTITYDPTTKKATITSDVDGATVYYSTDGSLATSSSSSAPSPVTVDVSDDPGLVSAYSVANSRESDVTNKVCVGLGSSHSYLIPSIDNNKEFYMVTNGTYAYTNSLPQASMEWYFQDAGTEEGVQYYYITNSSSEKKMYRNGTEIKMGTASTDAYKFSIEPYFEEGNLKYYNFVNKANGFYVYNNNGNGTVDAIILSNLTNTTYHHWNIIPLADENKPVNNAFVNVSADGTNHFYEIHSVAASTWALMPPTGDATNVTTINTQAVQTNYTGWYFEDAGNDGWATYYYIVNASTGKYLYFCKNDNTNTTSALEMKDTKPTDGDTDKDCYLFTFAKTITANQYYIVPKGKVADAKDKYSGLWRENADAVQQRANRGDNKIKWTFQELTQLNNIYPPTISYDVSTHQITMGSAIIGDEIRYTLDGTEPTAGSASYEDPLTLEAPSVVKAVIVRGAETSTVSIYCVPVFMTTGTDNPYLLASTEATGFYLLPGDVTSGNTTLNTNSLPHKTMTWLFEDAGQESGVQYYYIKNKEDESGRYLYNPNNTDNLYLNAKDETYGKFSIEPYIDENQLKGYYIKSKSRNKYVLKVGSNSAENVVNLNNAQNANSCWNIVSLTNETQPSNDIAQHSTETDTYYYEIYSVAVSTFMLMPPTGTETNVKTTSVTTTDDTKWYFKAVETDTWATYYRILNGNTNQYLYFSKTSDTDADAALIMKEALDESDDRYLFTFAKVYNNDEQYYIVPKVKADVTRAKYYGLYRENANAVQQRGSRSANQIKWTLKPYGDYIIPPVITYNAASNNVTLSCPTPAVTVCYTKDGTEVSTSSATSPLSFIPEANVTTIRAIAKKGEGETLKQSKETKAEIIQTTIDETEANKRPYQMQSTELQYYYILPSVPTAGDENILTVNTLNVPSTAMVWYFEDASIVDGVQYFYIKNSQGYLYHSGDNLYVKAGKVDSDDYKFKFVGSATDGYRITPKAYTKVVYKVSISKDPVKLASNSTAQSLWKLIPYTGRENLPQWKDKPFDESTDEETNYYQITSVSQITKPIILNNNGDIKSEIVPTSDYDTRKGMWVIKKVGSDTDGLLDYYTFTNAYTGTKLFYNGAGRKVLTSAFQIGMPTADSADDTWSYFVIVQTENGYNIIPKVIVDKTKDETSKAGYNCINRANGADILGTWFDDGNGSRWTFSPVEAAVKCMDPVFGEDAEGNITITSTTNAAKIRYTENGEDPTTESDVYTTLLPASQKKCIKAIAIIGEDAGSMSEVVTLLNCPDIDLDVDNYVYNKTAKEPAVTKVYIGDVVATEGTYSAPVYTNNTNAGTEIVKPTVTITDAVADDRLVIANAKKEFVIQPLEVTLNWANTTLTYNRSAQTPTATVTNCIEGDACNVTVAVEGETSHTDVGDYTAIAQSLDNTNYALPTENTMAFSIIRKSIGDGTSLAAGFIVTMGDGDNPTFTVKDGTEELIKDTEYEVSDPVTEDGNQVWTISGIGNYTGSTKLMRIALTFNETGEESGHQEHDVTPYQASADMTIAGLHSYIVTHINMTKRTVAIQEINYVPKDEPVLLLTDLTGETTNFTATPLHVAEGDKADTSGNLLQVSPEGGKAVGFGEVYMYYQGKFVMTTGGTLPEGKFYLKNPNPPSSSGGGGTSNAPLRIVIDDTTEIGTIDNGQLIMDNGQSGEWYTLDGRRLSGKPAKKGLYIWNGQKRVVK